MQPIAYYEGFSQVAERLSDGGIFLSCGGSKPNTMTIGWGSLGIYWGKPMFLVAVRRSRFTHQGILEKGAFSVSVPEDGGLKGALAFAGSASGATVNKFEGNGLTALDGTKMDVPIVKECTLHYECTVRYAQPMDASALYGPYVARFYPEGDFHDMFYGEIVSCYRTTPE